MSNVNSIYRMNYEVIDMLVDGMLEVFWRISIDTVNNLCDLAGYEYDRVARVLQEYTRVQYHKMMDHDS